MRFNGYAGYKSCSVSGDEMIIDGLFEEDFSD